MHLSSMQVPLYERGYEKDPAKVAFEAAKAAERSKIDVLLVDTAGGTVVGHALLTLHHSHTWVMSALWAVGGVVPVTML